MRCVVMVASSKTRSGFSYLSRVRSCLDVYYITRQSQGKCSQLVDSTDADAISRKPAVMRTTSFLGELLWGVP